MPVIMTACVFERPLSTQTKLRKQNFNSTHHPTLEEHLIICKTNRASTDVIFPFCFIFVRVVWKGSGFPFPF